MSTGTKIIKQWGKKMSHFPWLIQTVSKGFGEKEIQVRGVLSTCIAQKLSQVFLSLNRNTYKML